MEVVNLAGVLRDCMLLLARRLPKDVWVRAFLDAEETLALLPCLATTYTEWRDVVHGLMEFAALRVAIVDFGAVAFRGISRSSS